MIWFTISEYTLKINFFVEMVTKAIPKFEKAADQFSIVAEMLKSAGITGACLVTNWANANYKAWKNPFRLRK